MCMAIKEKLTMTLQCMPYRNCGEFLFLFCLQLSSSYVLCQNPHTEADDPQVVLKVITILLGEEFWTGVCCY